MHPHRDIVSGSLTKAVAFIIVVWNVDQFHRLRDIVFVPRESKSTVIAAYRYVDYDTEAGEQPFDLDPTVPQSVEAPRQLVMALEQFVELVKWHRTELVPLQR